MNAPVASLAGQRWIDVGSIDDIAPRSARVVKTPQGDIAIFRTMTDAFFAIDDRCPHKGGPLSQGIVHGEAVTCPLHNWSISLRTGSALGADKGCVKTIGLRIEEGRILLDLSSVLRLAA